MPPVIKQLRPFIEENEFLSQRFAFSKKDVGEYLSSIASTLIRHPSAKLSLRWRSVSASRDFKYWWDTDARTETPAYFAVLNYCADKKVDPMIKQLDHFALDLLDHMDDPYEVTPITAHVAKETDRGAVDVLLALCDRFNANSCSVKDAEVQTVVGEKGGPRNRANHFRIDRERLSDRNNRKYFVFRIQEGTSTLGGIYMETGVVFVLADVIAALKESLNGRTGFYVELSAPNWYRAVIDTPDPGPV